ncbi:MAG: trypsin-like peptidase domain-containing protein [Flavobacteriaceae bacterium]|nr:trypsin-like peptidase domain-containing protein [Flavobacteriaceae bacterium]
MPTDFKSFPDEISLDLIRTSRFDGICYQDVKRKGRGGTFHHSTSFFIARNFLLTSGHNVTKLYFGRNKPHKVYIHPSRIGDQFHGGSIEFNLDYNQNISLAPQYKFTKKKTRIPHDMALIYIPDAIIDKNESLSEISYLPFLEDLSSLEEGEPIYCVGYPASEGYESAFKMTLDESQLGSKHTSSFTHDLDTKTGNSGSPIMVKRNNQYHVIGINSIKYNGTLINQEKKNWIEKSMRNMPN